MNKILNRCAIVLFVAGSASAALADANSLNLLYSFDSANPVGTGWTQSMPRNDDGSSARIQLGFDFCFYDQAQSSLFINNNGNVTFGASYSPFSPSGFPSASVPAMIAPFWGDVDTRNTTGANTNLVWHRTFDSDSNGSPDVFVVTWDTVGYFSNQNDRFNTFQLALALDANFWGTGLNAAFSYGDMNWTTGSASNGVGGFGGSPATVGINNGDGIRFDQLGRFNQAGNNYNGFFTPSGIDVLDNRDFFFNACQGIVPAPSALALLGLGGMVVARRRR